MVQKTDEFEIARDVMARANSIVQEYSIIVKRDAQVGYVGSSLEMPTVSAHGRTLEECEGKVRAALAVAASVLLQEGRPPPVHGRRDAQVNVRLSAEEKARLAERARQEGYRGIGDFIRATVLRDAK